jgi:hypothetical protein
VNFVAARFQGDDSKNLPIPNGFNLVNKGTSQSKRIEVGEKIDKKGNKDWRSASVPGMLGSEHKLALDISIPGYTVDPVFGSHGWIDDVCHAIYVFKPQKTSWILEVLSVPEQHPYQYQKNADGTWHEGKVQRIELKRGEYIDIRFFTGTLYLFTEKDVLYEDNFLRKFNYMHLVRKIIKERVDGEVQSQDDPFLAIARDVKRSQESPEALEVAAARMRKTVKLRALTLSETTED